MRIGRGRAHAGWLTARWLERRPPVGVVFVAAALTLLASPASGQSPLDRVAGLTVDDELVVVTLRLLQQSAGVSLVYSPDFIPEGLRVSCPCRDVTVRRALDIILEGTGLTYAASRTLIRIVPEGTAAGEVPGAIGGRVLEAEGGGPVVNAMVRLEEGRGGLTDTGGRFLITNVPEGTHKLEVTSIGWETATVEGVEARNADTATVAIRLQRAVIPLREIRVAPGTFGFLEEVSPGTIRTLTRSEIQTMPQLGEDVFRALKRLPGVSAGDISAKLNIRGGTDQEVLIRLDGLELYEPYHMRDWDGALGVVDLNSLSGVELTAGGFGAEYGNKTTGVLDMTTRTTVGRPRTALGLSVSNVTALSHGGFADDRGAWLLSVRRGFMDLIMRMMGEDERLSPQYHDVFGKVSYQPAPHHLVSAQLLHTRDRFDLQGVEWDGFQAVPGLDEVDVGTRWDSNYGWLRWEGELSRRVSAETVGWVGRLDRKRGGYQLDFGTVGAPERIEVEDRRRFDFAGVRHDLSIDLSERALIKLGAELKKGRADYFYFGRTWTPELSEDSVAFLRVETLLVELEPEGHELGAYLSARSRVTDRFTAEVGLRYDRMSHTDESDVSPRLMLAFSPKPTTHLRASWGLYRQGHGVHALEVGDGEVEYSPSERADQLALGFEHRFPHNVSLRLELYRRVIADQRPRFINLEQELVIFPEREGDRFRFDPDRGRARGMELVVERRSGEHWAWSASYVLAEAEDEVEGRWVPRRLDQRHSIGLNLSYRPNRAWNLSWAWRHHSGWPATSWSYDATPLENQSVFWTRYFGMVRQERVPPYHRLDFRISREFRFGDHTLLAFVDVYNVYNRLNLESYNYEGGIRNGRVVVFRSPGQEQLPFLPTFGLRYEF